MMRTNVDAAYRKTKLQTKGDLQAMVDELAELPLEFSPGDQWNYSVSTDICGYLVEHFSGMKLDKYFQKYIFDPLGMEDTGFSCAKEKVERLASLYEHHPKKGPVLVDPGGPKTSRIKKRKMLSGGGGLLSTIADYYRFSTMLLNQGELGGNRIIGRKTLAMMAANHLPDGKDLTEMSQSAFSETTYQGVGFGLGFSVILDPVKTQSLTDVGEYGWGGAASTVFWVNPKEEMVVIFLTQLLPSSTYQVRRELRSLVYSALMPE